MELPDLIVYLPLLLTIIGILVVFTNIIVEVLKKATRDKLPTNFLVVLVSMALTVLVFLAWASITGFVVVWYHISAAVVVAFLVAYAAMFGYDKLCEALEKIHEFKAKKIIDRTDTKS